MIKAYHIASGAILYRVGGTPAAIAEQVPLAGQAFIETDHPAATHYVSGGVVVARPILTPPPLTVGEEWVTGAPEGTAVVVDGVQVGTLGADEPIAFDTPGTYRVELFPWLPVDVVVT